MKRKASALRPFENVVADVLLNRCFAAAVLLIALGQRVRLRSWLALSLALMLVGFLFMTQYHGSFEIVPYRRSFFARQASDVDAFPAFGRRAARPLLIPRIIHQTYSTFDAIPPIAARLRLSWVRLNPSWTVKFWDDASCYDFVKNEFPEYLRAYVGLPKDVERADFFRYMVVLRYGGLYADIDTECKQPLDSYILASDTLVVGWESEFPDEDAALRWHAARTRQVQQWAFAGAPNHPALRRICDHVAANYHRQFSPLPNFDTLERTGPGAWTDAVLATSSYEGVATGVHPRSKAVPELTMSTRGILVQHHFLGGWKARKGYGSGAVPRFLAALLGLGPTSHSPSSMATHAIAPSVVDTFPVSVNLAGTAFTVFVDQVGHGDLQSHEDVGAVLTRYGTWQAGMDKTAEPSAPAAIVGSLDKLGADVVQPVFLDVGAGVGFFSLTAAARGYHVIATELAPRSLHLMERSIQRNGFGKLVTLRNVTVGDAHSRGAACVEGPGLEAALATGWPAEDVARGLGDPDAHGTEQCVRRAERVTIGDLVPEGVRVGAIRISAGAWTSRALLGAVPFMAAHLPRAALLEVDMAAMSRIGAAADLMHALRRLVRIGYSDMAHAGHVCRERFDAMIRARPRKVGPAGMGDEEDEQAPTWCELRLENAAAILERNRVLGLGAQDPFDASGVELILLQRPCNASSAAAC